MGRPDLACMPSTRLQSFMNLHRASRVAEAEAGYRECLREGDDEAAMPLATLLLQQARYAEAAMLLEPLAGASPERADIAVNLSVALRHCGRLDDAFEAARLASVSAPAQVSVWNALGLAALDLGRTEEALAAFTSGIELAPSHPVLALHRAHALRRLARNAEALPAYEQAVRANPRLVEGWRGLAQVQATLGQAEAALHCRARALQLAPHDHEVAFEHAVALLQADQTEAAVRWLGQAVRTHPDDAQAWAWLGRARLKQRDLDGARDAFERAHAIDPADATIAHFHAASTGRVPEGVESEYIRRLFDDFADRFEDTLVVRLAYDTPRRMMDFLRRHGAETASTVLDLGCGTGLMGQQLARSGRSIDGVDLSPRMLDHARAKEVYRDLHAGEVVEFMRRQSTQWQLVVAVDVLIYLRDLRPLFAAALPCVAPAGCFAFTIERGSDDTELQPVTGRYRHAPARVVAELAEAGFVDIARDAVVLRMESGQPVAGELLLARRP